jgi:outer membrane protein assembly factor BamA
MRAISTLTCFVLAVAMVSGRQKTGELSGIGGVPVEGHDIAAGIEIVGTKQIHLPEIRKRLQLNWADIRLGFPIEGQTLCRFKEVLRDVMSEKGFRDALIAHHTRPAYGNPQHLTIRFTIVEGKKSRPVAQTGPALTLTPAQRCDR